ncbi:MULTISPECIES: response regulator transcription factor [Pantoea]|uniref:DNA-binding response regulator n=3 Tax=Pantoea stewartii subsp. stewartii TaxID=66271 RepID=A0ABM6KCI9_PANSE|nr:MULTISPECIES: response regulator transcription factor [Pantoea]AAG01455.1 HrpY [Pantoea stewartii subsp. stewartii]ARF52497.1 DNA-binding response regulator [Pantoea stewartii subsp. stewartii DC283]KAB0552737.1 response regulator transcription factor [Pantoea stewartii subsp. stewartii]KGD80076.1 LuxR family transcriptional regulator [Pantoea stewartii subsp. indologenes]KHE01075.1 LuxR family transcriptional regulator [Pantoea stewartii]
MDNTIRIMIVDDHVIMREGLKQIFSLDERLVVVSEAGNGTQVMEGLRNEQVDLLLLDMCMPGLCGEELISRIHSLYPQLPILILTMYSEPQIARRVLKCGALGYITKDNDPETLLAAIHRVARGQRFIDQMLAEQIVFNENMSANEGLHQQLTAREMQIMLKLARGEGVNSIAEALAISNKTVSTHKARLMEKMMFKTNADIVKYAISHHLIS